MALEDYEDQAPLSANADTAAIIAAVNALTKTLNTLVKDWVGHDTDV